MCEAHISEAKLHVTLPTRRCEASLVRDKNTHNYANTYTMSPKNGGLKQGVDSPPQKTLPCQGGKPLDPSRLTDTKKGQKTNKEQKCDVKGQADQAETSKEQRNRAK